MAQRASVCGEDFGRYHSISFSTRYMYATVSQFLQLESWWDLFGPSRYYCHPALFLVTYMGFCRAGLTPLKCEYLRWFKNSLAGGH